MSQESIKKTIIGLFQTISPRQMGLTIWLVAYFLAYTFGHKSRPLAGLCVPFWVHLGVPKCRKAALKINFLLVSDYLSYKIGPIDLVRGLLSSSDIGTYILPTSGPLYSFLGPSRCPIAPKQHKNIFWLFWTISPLRMSLLIWLGAYFHAKTLGHTSPPLAGLCILFLGPFGGPQMSQNSIKRLYCFGIFLLQEWAY